MTQIKHFLESTNVDLARKALKEKGFYLIPEAYPKNFCQLAIKFLDCYQDPKSEINYAGTELRIWDAQKKDELLQQFFLECNFTLSRLLCRDVEAETLLAIRNQQLSPADDALKMGRWHIDSFSKQLKIFLFLTETTEKSGPFEFIPKTHKNIFKWTNLCKGTYIKPKDLLSRKRSYQKLNDRWIAKLNEKGYESIPVICPAGTILIVDTSAIHRARPCMENARYALTTYYR